MSTVLSASVIWCSGTHQNKTRKKRREVLTAIRVHTHTHTNANTVKMTIPVSP